MTLATVPPVSRGKWARLALGDYKFAYVRTRYLDLGAYVLPIIREMEKAGAASLNAIAAKLNERNVPTARGGRWTHVQVGAVLRPFADGAASAVM